MNLINFTNFYTIPYSEFSNPSNRKAALPAVSEHWRDRQDISGAIRNIRAEPAILIELNIADPPSFGGINNRCFLINYKVPVRWDLNCLLTSTGYNKIMRC